MNEINPLSKNNINADKITKPIQLLAAWLIGLILLVGALLTAARVIERPDWAPAFLIISAVAIIPLFLLLIFLLQTRYRPEMLEDRYYAKYLDKNTQKFVNINFDDIVEGFERKINELNEKINERFGNEEILSKKDIKIESEIEKFSYLVSNLPDVNKFIDFMAKKGYGFTIYQSFANKTQNKIDSMKDHEAIWLGKNISFQIAKRVLIESRNFYTQLKYIHISTDANYRPEHIHDQIFIGGSTSSAVNLYKLKSISGEDFNSIQTMKTKEELFEFIRNYYSNTLK